MEFSKIQRILDLLNLEIDSKDDGVLLGYFQIIDNEDLVIDLMNNYFSYVYKIYSENNNFIGNNQYKIETQILKRFFPRFKDYVEFFSLDSINNILFNKLEFIPRYSDELKTFKLKRKATKTDYVEFVKEYANNTIQKRLVENVPLYVRYDYFKKSVYISGKSGSGKTEILKNIALSQIQQNNNSIIIFDIHGDYSLQIAQKISNTIYKNNILFIDLFAGDDYGKMPSLNPFEIVNKKDDVLIGYAVQNLLNTLKSIIGSEFSLVMESLLTPMLQTLFRLEGATLYDLYKFCDDDLNKDLVQFGIENCDPMNSFYLKNDFYKADARTKKALKTRLQLLLNNPKFAQFLTGKSTFNLQEAMNNNKIIIFRFNKIKLREVLSPIGRFIISLIQTYAMLRESIEERYRPTTYLYLDEFQNFVSEDIDEILSESRKYGLYLVLAHQFLAQIENVRLRESILTNTQIKITGMNAYNHNQAMTKQFGVTLEDLNRLKKPGEFYFKKNNDKAIKFVSSTKYLNFSLNYEEEEEWLEVLNTQIMNYYKYVQERKSLFTEVPIKKKEKKEHYSVETKDKLLSEIKDNQDDEDELLDY